MTTSTPLRALYYPYARTISETTLKRAVLLYDETIFLDPQSSRVRQGLYDAGRHLQHLPADVAADLEREWDEVSRRYRVLEDAGAVRVVDPGPVVADPATGRLTGDALGADLADRSLDGLFAGYPTTWSMLRSRIPEAAFSHLAHQIPARVLGADPTIPTDAGVASLFIDGRPDAAPVTRPTPLPDDGREYAALLPVLAGSSIAVSTALAVVQRYDAVPLTDSDAHFRLLSARLHRAASAAELASQLPGLAPRPDLTHAQRTALVHQRVVDSVISYDDWQSLSLEDCLRYRDATAEERAQFRSFLASVVGRVTAQPWTSESERLIAEAIAAANAELADHASSLRAAYRNLFTRTLIGLSVAAAPALLAAAFPAVSPLTALLFGGGQLSGLLIDPVKELLTLWSGRHEVTGSLAYLMELPRH